MSHATTSELDIQSWALQFVFVWALGLVLGWLLPKPKWVDRGLKAKALLMSTPPGLWFRRAALAAHATLIVREVWRNLYVPGTFRGVLKNLWITLTTGQRFQWPQLAASDSLQLAPDAAVAVAAEPAADIDDNWYIGRKELAEFKWVIDENGRPANTGAWEPMMTKQWPGSSYTAWRRTLPSGKSEYKSVTISENATAEEFMDFYLDDEKRDKWDSMISETQLLETGTDAASRCQVVRWLRTFPFAFISQREYIIARRFFREADGSLFAVTKGIEHSAAPDNGSMVRMEDYHSYWRSRTVPCPHGSNRPACETTLLHFEDFKIPERLARFAVRHGMAGFVKGMIPAVQAFVAERRTRCEPFEVDPASFGCRQLAARPPPGAPSAADLDRAGSLASTVSYTDSMRSSAGSVDDSASERSGRMQRTTSMYRLGAMMVASGVAIAIAGTSSGGSLTASGSGSGKRRHGTSGSGAGHRKHQSGSHGHRSHRHSAADMPAKPRRRQQEEVASVEA